jgi:ankyrin repeat protein
MATTLTVDEVNALIAEHSAGAGDAVGQLATPCQQGEDGQTPLNVAIESGNHGITSQLVESKEGINFAPSIDADLLAPVKHTVSAMFNGENVEETEKYLIKSFGPRMCWQRTPLHTACRYANEDAIELLISRNASLTAKDILGLTPLELCLQFGGEDSVSRFVACCTTHNRRLPITELVLKTVCRDPLFYQQLIEQGALDAKAKRFAFNLACALLDKDGMDQMLSQKLDINKTMNDEFSPVMEVCTSRLLTFCEHPEAPRLAGQLAAASNAASGAIHIDNDAIMNAESLEDLEKLFGGAFDEQADKQAELTSYTLSEQERQLQLKQRLSLIDYLAQQGLDVGMAESKAPYGFLGEIVSMNSPELLQALVNKGFLLKPEAGEKDTEVLMALSKGLYKMVDPLLQLGHRWGSINKEHPDWVQAYSDWKQANANEVFTLELPDGKRAQPERARKANAKSIRAIRESKWTWELAGESVLLAETDPKKPKHEKPVIVRLTYSNVYGPVDGAQLYVRVGDPDKPTAFDDLDSGGKWQPVTLVEELLSIDGEEVDRSSLSEPVYGETPWDATYERELSFPQGKHSIEIKVVSEAEGMNGVLSDWIVNVSGSQ